GIPADAEVIGCVCNLLPLKGVHDFVAMAGALLDESPTRHAVLVGGDFASQRAYADRIRAQAAVLPAAERLRLVGFQQDVPAWLRCFDVLVFPSYTEACPILVLEAMDAGLPLVVTAVGEVPRMVQDVPGVPVHEPGDIAAML